MYLPLELNTPALVGGFLVHFLNKRAEAKGASIRERGIVVASGLMAGGALGGVFGASLRLVPGFSEDWLRSPFYGDAAVSQLVALALFVALCVYVWRTANRAEGALG
jgi:OPT oligopeptide transporter protein